MTKARQIKRQAERREHNYRCKLERILSGQEEHRGAPLERGKLTHIMVRHDDWCDVFRGGVCNCNPDISFMSHEQWTMHQYLRQRRRSNGGKQDDC